ncbi:MAG: hypothetical protein K9N55_09050 [Phycisphaerae bacterium]|nr:hypothetical protein [Phycisphaerae bacterium]
MRFVIHEHQKQGEPVHWDLMLELDDVLKTFRLDCAPQHMLTQSCAAAPIFDHDTRFLQYEGPVQKGLGRVRQVDRGTYESVIMTQHTWTVNLQGSLIKACVELPLHQKAPLVIANI